VAENSQATARRRSGATVFFYQGEVALKKKKKNPQKNQRLHSASTFMLK